jgi:hypothetical protein
LGSISNVSFLMDVGKKYGYINNLT